MSEPRVEEGLDEVIRRYRKGSEPMTADQLARKSWEATESAPERPEPPLAIESGEQPARLAAFLCRDAQEYGYDHGANPTLADSGTSWPSCPRHQAMAANLFAAPSPTPVLDPDLLARALDEADWRYAEAYTSPELAAEVAAIYARLSSESPRS